MPDPDSHPSLRPTLGAILLFIISVVTGLVALGYAIFLFASTQNSIVMTVRQNQLTSDQRWCATIDLLTRNPVPKPSDPKANPSREASWELYEDFITLRREFQCPLH